MKEVKKRLKAKLELHLANPRTFPHEISTFIYILILIDFPDFLVTLIASIDVNYCQTT